MNLYYEYLILILIIFIIVSFFMLLSILHESIIPVHMNNTNIAIISVIIAFILLVLLYNNTNIKKDTNINQNVFKDKTTMSYVIIMFLLIICGLLT